MPKTARLRFGRIVSHLIHPQPRTLTQAWQCELILVAALGLSAFYLTALASFSPLDPSWFAVVHPPAGAHNLAGQLGAHLAATAIFLLGAVAWAVPAPLLGAAWLVFRKNPHALARSRLVGWLVAGVCAAALVDARFGTMEIDGFQLASGGEVGTWLSAALSATFGPKGSLIVCLTCALCSLLMILRRGLLTPLWHKAAAQLRLPDWHWQDLWSWLARLRAPDKSRSKSPATAAAAPAPLLPVEPLVAAAAAPLASAALASTALDVAPVFGLPQAATALGEDSLEGEGESEPEDGILLTAASMATSSPRRERSVYAPPSLTHFKRADASRSPALDAKELEATAVLLVKTFEEFGVCGRIVGYQPGPVVTVFEFQPDAGVKQAKVLGLIDDLALTLKVDSIFIHPVKGKRALGIQVPNTARETVYLGDILAATAFQAADSPLTFGMGKTLNGQPMCADLAAMPHLLAAGATGSGKSVAINALLCSIVMKASPDDVRMILVDPKMLELSVYEGIPHLLMPVITEPAKASLALKWATEEMERRYRLMQHACVRNISGYNAMLEKMSAERRDALLEASGELELNKLPYILLVIDELADLMMTAPKDVESSIQRLAQKARASGIHMVLATQRPSVDIITGVIKANLPCRIAFQVVSKHDSRTILDLIGADKLLGRGDMLLQRPGIGRLERIQGALITDEEVLALVAAAKEQGSAQYDADIMAWIEDELARQKESSKEGLGGARMDDDPKWDEALNLAQSHGMVSASFLQRHLKIGYNRAARIVEFMEAQGMVAKADGAKPRRWLGLSGQSSAAR